MHPLVEQMVKSADERNMKAPEGLLYGVRSVRHDFTSRHGFRWSFPGHWAKAQGPFSKENTGGCPSAVGDGICLAHTWSGMASGQIPALTLLLVGYREADVLGSEYDGSKIRVKKAFVRDVFDGQALLLKAEGADLYGANLGGANLSGADLGGANLRSANLGGADLRSANLGGADLRSANLGGANLYGTNLGGADLSGADLRSADLRSANLRSADLYGADLYGADLGGANLSGADLRSANLRSANLGGADLGGADLRSANLRSANLGGADLGGADLGGADLGGYERGPDGFAKRKDV